MYNNPFGRSSLTYILLMSPPWTSNVKGQIERKFSKSKTLPNFDLSGALEIRGMKVAIFLLQKANRCVNPRRLSHFA